MKQTIDERLERLQAVIIIGMELGDNKDIHTGDRGRVVWKSKYWPIYKVKVGPISEYFWREQLARDED